MMTDEFYVRCPVECQRGNAPSDREVMAMSLLVPAHYHRRRHARRAARRRPPNRRDWTGAVTASSGWRHSSFSPRSYW